MYSLISFFCAITCTFFFVNEGTIDLKEVPSSESKMVSQAFFSENVTIQEEVDDWICIVTEEGYSGWALAPSLIPLVEPYNANLQTCRLKSHLYGVKDTEYAPLKTLPYGSKLKAIEEDTRWFTVILPDGSSAYLQKGDATTEMASLTNKEELVAFSQKFLDLPYTWGGRSSFGFDCSGFIQRLYKEIGIDLSRDSKQQVLDKRFKIVTIDSVEPGDLVFFGKSKNQIMHVGMCIGQNKFIHASVRENQPWVRISSFSDFEWSENSEAYYPYRTMRQLLKEEKSLLQNVLKDLL